MKRCAALGVATVSVFAQTATVRVDITPGHVINSFDPDSALGSSIDVLSESSNTCDLHGSEDIRNCVGYAIEDFKAGSAGADGVFNGIEGQNRYVSSSIDPWHAAADVNATGDRSASVIPHGPSDGG